MHSEIAGMFDLTGKVALVTGGATYLGFDAASVLAAAGCDVAITSRSLERAEESAGTLCRQYGVGTLSVELDQTEFSQVERAVNEVLQWKGRIDILINNAGGGGASKTTARLLERDPKDIDQMISLNLNGVLYCCREAGRAMVEQGSGKIVNIASMAGMLGRDRRIYDKNGMNGQPVDYAAAKAGVIGLTRDLAGYLSPKGVYVNAISPGGFARDFPGNFEQDYSDRTPLGRMGRYGTDLKGAILFLASPASDYVTGQNLVLDGGFTIWR